MASSVIHMAVASEINKVIKRDEKSILIGSIAPDISKLIGESKTKSHFLDSEDNNIPNIDKFLYKYKKYMSDDFVMGYFIHLYTDYLWFKYFITDILNEEKNIITKLDGTKIKFDSDMLAYYIYNDYTNLNIRLLEEYDMDLKIFYNDIPKMNNIIDEIPMNKLDILINKAGLIIENSKVNKEYIFNMDNIISFINTSEELILAKIKEIFEDKSI